MLFLGHMGIGTTALRFWERDLPKRGLVLGTVLPDLIDKTLYYGLVLWTGKWGAELGLISGTRTLGHSGIMLLAVTLLALVGGSRWAIAVGLGIVTHLALDIAFDPIALFDRAPTVHAILFPFAEGFTPIFSTSATAHVRNSYRFLPIVLAESLGLVLLVVNFRRWRRAQRIAQTALSERRRKAANG